MGEGSNFSVVWWSSRAKAFFLLFMVLGQVFFEEERRLRWLGAFKGVQTGVSKGLGFRWERIEQVERLDEKTEAAMRLQLDKFLKVQ